MACRTMTQIPVAAPDTPACGSKYVTLTLTTGVPTSIAMSTLGAMATVLGMGGVQYTKITLANGRDIVVTESIAEIDAQIAAQTEE